MSDDFEYAVKNLMVLIAAEGEEQGQAALEEAKRRLADDDGENPQTD